MKTIEVICHQCQNPFQMSKGEYNRANKRGYNKYCSSHCRRIHQKEHGLNCVEHLKTWVNSEESKSNAKKANAARWQNQPEINFSEILRRSRQPRSRNRILENQLTEEMLFKIWNEQNGMCPFTGWKLKLPTCTKKKTPQTASLDRIDSHKGYIEGNVQFVSVMINLAKCDFSQDELLDFCSAIKNT